MIPASNHAAGGSQPMDALIPPPWPTWRRVVAFTAAFVLLAVLVGVVRSGAVGPRLVHDNGWGSSSQPSDDGGVIGQRFLPLRNTGWLPVTVRDVELPDLDGVSWGSVPGLPVTIGPGEVHEVTVPFEVDACRTIDVDGYDVFAVRAQSGIAPPRIIEVQPPSSSGSMFGSTYTDEDGNQVTLPVWPEQPPSWILDAIDPTCNEPPN